MADLKADGMGNANGSQPHPKGECVVPEASSPSCQEPREDASKMSGQKGAGSPVLESITHFGRGEARSLPYTATLIRPCPSQVGYSQGILLVRDRALGCLLGQVSGDSLGSLVEFRRGRDIRRLYPEGIHTLRRGGARGLLPGQPTDDSEMALCLARTLVRNECFHRSAVEASYKYWLSTDPPDIGNTIRKALQGTPTPGSISNGALMRVSPLGIFASSMSEFDAMAAARDDASITHVHRVCQDASALFVAGIRQAILSGNSPMQIYRHMCSVAEATHMAPTILVCLRRGVEERPRDYFTQMGYALIALQNAVFELLHAASPDEGIERTVCQGGDTDTNAAICGALLGAVYGSKVFPKQWCTAIANCRPAKGTCQQPRPRFFWPVDLPELADELSHRARIFPKG